MLHAISFRLATLDTSLPEGGNREEQAPPLPKLILPRKINFTCAKHKLHCKATSLGVAKLHRTARCLPSVKSLPPGGRQSGGASPSPTGTLCRIRRMAVYHQGSALYIITPWCVSFHNIRVANTSLVQSTNFTAKQLHLAKSNFTAPSGASHVSAARRYNNTKKRENFLA